MTPRTSLPQAVLEAATASGHGPAADAPPAFTLKPAVPARAGASDPAFVAASLAQLVDAVTSCDDDHSAWRAIGDIAATLISGAEQADVVVFADERQSDDGCGTATGDVQLLMKVQDDTGEGPCLDAARTGEQILVQDLRSDARWPHFTPRTPWHIHSMLCTAVPVSGGRVGVLTLLSARAWAFDEAAARLATVIADHAALALRLTERIRNLQAMVDSREIIGQATGILMQRHQLPAEQAFHVLARASQERNVKVRTLAEQLIDTVTSPASYPGQGEDDTRRTDAVSPAGGGRPSGQK